MHDKKSPTAMHWHSQVKNTEQDVSLTKNDCITVCMQKISSIHKLILDYIMPIFDCTYPKIIQVTFSFLGSAPACKKISSFHLFILENVLINFLFMYINIPEIRLFHWLILKIWLVKKFHNLIGWEQFGL